VGKNVLRKRSEKKKVVSRRNWNGMTGWYAV
jgi:hypothetical protein